MEDGAGLARMALVAIDVRHWRDFGYGTYIRNLVRTLAKVESEFTFLLIARQEHVQELAGLPGRFQVTAYERTDKERIDNIAFPWFLRTLKPDLVHIPLNAVPWAWNALMTYRLDWLPATVGAQLVGVGPFYTTNANLYEAKERTTLDAWVTFDVGQGKLRVRGRNLTDEFYAEWADYNATSLYVGAPRSFDVTYSIKW